MIDHTMQRLAEIVGLDVDSAEFERVALELADLLLAKSTGLRFAALADLERYRRLRGGKPVTV